MLGSMTYAKAVSHENIANAFVAGMGSAAAADTQPLDAVKEYMRANYEAI